MMINIDVVIANCSMTLDELNQLNQNQIKPIENFIQHDVLLKSGGEVLASGVLIKVDDQFCVSIDQVNDVQRNNNNE